MRYRIVLLAVPLILLCAASRAVEMPKIPDIGAMSKGSVLDKVNKSLADQQQKDGQFEFKTGKAEFASGNTKRVSGLLKVISNYSKTLSAVPNLHVSAEGHTDSDGTAEGNQKLSLARAQTVCGALKAKGMKMPCTPSGAGSVKPLVSPEKTAADKQKNRRVLVQIAK
jgi:outer membrane protein OmpA-like peptidoglycan-associated protein